jgi:hypothetical protein
MRPSCSNTAAAPERTSLIEFQVFQVPDVTVGIDALNKKTQVKTTTEDRNILLRTRIALPT